MRARHPDDEGYVERDGVKLHYEVHGTGGPTLLLLPTWTVVHKRFWKLQVPYLARHFRVVIYDGPGNGAADRPVDARPYTVEAQVTAALDVLDVTGTDQAVVVSLSRAAEWALALAAGHPERALGLVFIAPALALASNRADRSEHHRPEWPAPTHLEASSVPLGGQDPTSHWRKYNFDHWRHRYEDFLWFFFGQCLSEPHSTKPIEDGLRWGMETSGEVLIAEHQAPRVDEQTLRSWCRGVSAPVLVLHGSSDRVSTPHRSEVLAELTGRRARGARGQRSPAAGSRSGPGQPPHPRFRALAGTT